MNRLSWFRAATLFAALAGAAGCGQKGALYLPEHNGTVITRQGAPQTNAPAQTPATTPAADPTKKNTNSDDSPAK